MGSENKKYLVILGIGIATALQDSDNIEITIRRKKIRKRYIARTRRKSKIIFGNKMQ